MSSHRPQPPAQPSGKLPIPRLERHKERPPKRPPVQRQARVSRACLNCRARKIRCNGAQPVCQNCADDPASCVYAASRKDKLRTATHHNQDLIHLLRELRERAASPEQEKIDKLLADTTQDVTEAASTLQGSSEKPLGLEGEDEANVSAEVGSNEDLDKMDEDIMCTEKSRATGYMGKNSEVQWFRKLHHEADGSIRSRGPYGPPGKSEEANAERLDAMRRRNEKGPRLQMNTNSCSFFLDDDSMDIDFAVDAFELPSFEVATRLLKCYMVTVQNSFPVLSQKTFTSQFYHYYNSIARGTPYKLPQKWQAMLNLIFAIGATYSHLIEADWSGDEGDHLLYHSRAWALSLGDPRWLTHPGLSQMQITGLLSFYYMCIGHVNRAWVVIGMSARFGFSLGLHIRNEDQTATVVKKEILSRIWWAVFSLDRSLSAITGRPSVGGEIDCSTTLPLPIPAEEIDEATISAKFGPQPNWSSLAVSSPSGQSSEASSSRSMSTASNVNISEPSNAGTFLTCTVKLGILSNKVLTRLYSANVTTESWKDVQQSIAQLLQDLEEWVVSLPKGLDPFRNDASDQTMQQERNLLRTYYHSTKILICRPCLCRLDRRIPSQSQSSDHFNQKIAANCVASAKAIAACIPEDVTVFHKDIYGIFPWWATIHYVMQSIAILLLEACYEAEEMSIVPLKMLVRSLRALKRSNKMARRAYPITMELLKKLAVRKYKDSEIRQKLSDLVAEDPQPEAYEAIATGSTGLWYTEEEYFEQNPLQQASTYPGMSPVDVLPAIDTVPGATDQPLPELFHEALHTSSPLANIFLTEFDQPNPLPFGVGDVDMQDGIEEEQQRSLGYDERA